MLSPVTNDADISTREQLPVQHVIDILEQALAQQVTSLEKGRAPAPFDTRILPSSVFEVIDELSASNSLVQRGLIETFCYSECTGQGRVLCIKDILEDFIKSGLYCYLCLLKFVSENLVGQM